MSFNIEVQGGTSVRLPTAGKYCDRDIVITATGGGEAIPSTIGENLHDVSTDVQNKYIDNDNIIDYAGWDLTDYIPVEYGKYYIVYSNGSFKADYCSVFDENKVFKERLSGNITSTDLKLPIFITGRQNGYIRFSGAHNQISAMEFYEMLNFKWEVPNALMERNIEGRAKEDYPEITGG